MARRTRFFAVALAIGLALTGVTVVATGRVAVASPVEANAGTSLTETAAAGFTFETRAFENVSLGTTITLTFFDADLSSPHTFTIVNAPNVQIPVSDSAATLGALVHTDGTLVNATASTGTNNGYGNATFTSPSTPGWYEFVCIESGHFQQGMYGFIAFGEPLPSNLTFSSGSPGPGLAVFIIIGTIVALTVLAIVLGFVVGQRRGSEHEMPPERLGYPEPSTPEPLPASSPPPRPPAPP
ncbi:MAG TPA: sulfocyanin-like copper-binding protein [Thermoplasmata archaeon]|nr:sulfocyanin-like copper-binding protein [Thermoplasmata archaeon]